MLIWYEIKKIFSIRHSIIFAVLLLVTFATTSIVVGLQEPTPREITQSKANIAQQRFENLENGLVVFNSITLESWQTNLVNSYTNFINSWTTFSELPIGSQLETEFPARRGTFNTFYDLYSANLLNTLPFFIENSSFIEMRDSVERMYELFNPGDHATDQIGGVRSEINQLVFNTNIIQTLENMTPQILTPGQQSELETLSNTISSTTLSQSISYDVLYAYYNNKYFYLRQQVNVAVASNTIQDVRGYYGFEYFGTTRLDAKLLVARYLIDNERTSLDYSIPFSFMGFISPSNGVTIFDFIFSNLELAIIPLVLLIVYMSILVFNKDVNNGTSLFTIATRKSRFNIISSKILTLLILSLTGLLLLTTLYAVTGAIFIGSNSVPPILTTFNGTGIVIMQPLSIFLIYFLSLIFKLFSFAVIISIFSMMIKKIKPLIILSSLIIVAVVLLNLFLSPFNFFRFIPTLALDFSIFWGIDSLWVTLPMNFNFWFVFPVMFGIIGLILFFIISKFNKKDF
ncbi:MAG: hypothetical protein FWE45_03480 [Firmicutes bacterium]|nr:hypothetical protein [Bacillota bacterium]